MNCEKCGMELNPEDVYVVKEKSLCEDCAITQQKTLQKCDPGAVHSALKTRKMLGQTGTEGLTPLQKEIYGFISVNNGATMTQFVNQFNLTPEEIDTELTILRHLELGKGQKREDDVYFVLWDA